MCNTHTFAAAACVAFAQKYATKRCDILRREDVKNPLHKVVLAKYGDKIRAIYMNYQDTALLALIERKCSNLKSVELFNISKMPKLRGLKKLHLPKGTNFSKKTFTTLINNNPQLEFFKINNIKSVFLNALDGQLDMLKELALFNIRSVNDVSKIRLSSLEKLSINATETTDCIGILQAINCNDIKVLNIDAYDFNDKCAVMIDEICAFKSLVSLRLVACAFTITTSQLHKLAAHLPHLIEFSMALPDGSPSLEDLEDEILSVVSILPNLSKLTIHLFGDDFKQFLNDLKTSIYDFHECFANISTEIDVIYSFSKVSTSEDRIFVYDTKSESVELHWMDNLNETSVQKVTRGFWTWVAAIKLVNNCKDQTFDLSTFMQSSIEHTRCLDIRSYGPITVNANVSGEFFRILDALDASNEYRQYLGPLHTRNVPQVILSTEHETNRRSNSPQ